MSHQPKTINVKSKVQRNGPIGSVSDERALTINGIFHSGVSANTRLLIRGSRDAGSTLPFRLRKHI